MLWGPQFLFHIEQQVPPVDSGRQSCLHLVTETYLLQYFYESVVFVYLSSYLCFRYLSQFSKLHLLPILFHVVQESWLTQPYQRSGAQASLDVDTSGWHSFGRLSWCRNRWIGWATGSQMVWCKMYGFYHQSQSEQSSDSSTISTTMLYQNFTISASDSVLGRCYWNLDSKTYYSLSCTSPFCWRVESDVATGSFLAVECWWWYLRFILDICLFLWRSSSQNVYCRCLFPWEPIKDRVSISVCNRSSQAAPACSHPKSIPFVSHRWPNRYIFL